MAQSSKPATTRPAELDKLIEQLGSGEWKIRDAAQKKLVDLGQPAVGPMNELAASSADPEVRQRARDVVKQIQGSDYSKPSLVTLHFKNAPASEVYQSLYEQAHAQVVTWPQDLFQQRARFPQQRGDGRARSSLVTIDADKTPFWNAMLELQKQTGLMVRAFGNEMQLADDNLGGHGPLDAKHVYVSGPYMVLCPETFGPGSAWELDVMAEPRLNVLQHARLPEITEAVDATGKPIEQGLANAHFKRRAGQPPEFEDMPGNAFQLHLNQPLRDVGRLSGVVHVIIGTRDTTIDVKDVAAARNLDQVYEGRRVLLNVMNPVPNDWLLQLVVFNTNPPVAGLTKMRIALTDAKGNALQSTGTSERLGRQRVDWQLAFQQGPNCGPPAKLSLTMPNETREVQVPFAFGDKPAVKEKVE